MSKKQMSKKQDMKAFLRMTGGEPPLNLQVKRRSIWHVALQEVCVEWFRHSAWASEGKLISGRLNGQYMGGNSARWGKQAKELGALPGECDLCVPGFSAHGSCCGLVVELKVRPDKPSAAQMQHHEKLRALGLYVAVVHSLKDAEGVPRSAGGVLLGDGLHVNGCSCAMLTSGGGTHARKQADEHL